MASLPKEIVEKLINLGSVQKKLYCLNCNDFTPHISVSWAYADRGTLNQIIGRINDWNPVASLVTGIPYTCLNCKAILYSGGLISDPENQRLKKIRQSGQGGWFNPNDLA